MAQAQHTPALASLEEAIMVLFRVVDDTYALLNPRGLRHEPLKRLSDSEILTLGGDAGGVGDEDHGQDMRLYPRLPRQPAHGSSARTHQGALGVILATPI